MIKRLSDLGNMSRCGGRLQNLGSKKYASEWPTYTDAGL